MSTPECLRLEILRDAMARVDLPVLLLTDLANIQYLTGFTGTAAKILVTDESFFFFTDGRYEVQAAADLDKAGLGADLRVLSAGEEKEIASCVAGMARVGFESQTISWKLFHRLESAISVVLVPVENMVEQVRARKDEKEIAAITAAVALADTGLAEALAVVDPSLTTESDLALSIEWEMRVRGATGVSFPLIVAAGARAALPHASPTQAVLGRHVPVIIDIGCKRDAYCSDMTRTVCWGTPSAETERVHDVVVEAQNAARAAVRAGVPCKDIDAAARDVITEAGYGDAFIHATGHGIGLVVHEVPFLSGRSSETLEAGNVITLEPGIYLPGSGGVRIEDIVVVTEEGCETLTQSPRDLFL